MLQLNSLKLESWKFNIIINIINITFGSGVAGRLNALRYNFVEGPNILRFKFFLIFFIQKKLARSVARATFLVKTRI